MKSQKPSALKHEFIQAWYTEIMLSDLMPASVIFK